MYNGFREQVLDGLAKCILQPHNDTDKEQAMELYDVVQSADDEWVEGLYLHLRDAGIVVKAGE